SYHNSDIHTSLGTTTASMTVRTLHGNKPFPALASNRTADAAVDAFAAQRATCGLKDSAPSRTVSSMVRVGDHSSSTLASVTDGREAGRQRWRGMKSVSFILAGSKVDW
ncbi:hypothetical protein JCM10207_008981, partial [Rhodosporidiobolus poonsookiae]